MEAVIHQAVCVVGVPPAPAMLANASSKSTSGHPKLVAVDLVASLYRDWIVTSRRPTISTVCRDADWLAAADIVASSSESTLVMVVSGSTAEPRTRAPTSVGRNNALGAVSVRDPAIVVASSTRRGVRCSNGTMITVTPYWETRVTNLSSVHANASASRKMTSFVNKTVTTSGRTSSSSANGFPAEGRQNRSEELLLMAEVVNHDSGLAARRTCVRGDSGNRRDTRRGSVGPADRDATFDALIDGVSKQRSAAGARRLHVCPLPVVNPVLPFPRVRSGKSVEIEARDVEVGRLDPRQPVGDVARAVETATKRRDIERIGGRGFRPVSCPRPLVTAPKTAVAIADARTDSLLQRRRQLRNPTLVDTVHGHTGRVCDRIPDAHDRANRRLPNFAHGIRQTRGGKNGLLALMRTAGTSRRTVTVVPSFGANDNGGPTSPDGGVKRAASLAPRNLDGPS